MLTALIKKEVREKLWLNLLFLLLFLGLAVSLPPTWPMLQNFANQGNLSALPFQEVLTVQVRDYNLYLWANWYGKNLWQFLIALAFLSARTLFEGEVRKGTLDQLLTKPISRRQVLAVKYGAQLMALLAVAAVPTLALPLISAAFGQPLAALPFVQGLLEVLPALAFLYTVAVIGHLAGGWGLKGMGGGIALLALLPVPAWLTGISWLNPYYWLAAAGIVRPGPWNPSGAVVLLLATALLYAIARRLWEKAEW